TDVESDAMELTLPVVPFGVKLAMPRSGSIAGLGTSDTVQQLMFPAGAESGTRKLTIGLTPSMAGTVFAALEFLTSYPYGCTEQTMSSFLPDVLVANAMQKLGVKSNIDPQTLKKQVQAGLDRLYNYQHPDGGWAWWQTDTNYLMDFSGDTTPQATAYVLKLLTHTAPNSPLAPKAAVYLVNHREEGYYWGSTEQTAMVIYGLTDYLAHTQELKPNYSIDVQVNGKTVA